MKKILCIIFLTFCPYFLFAQETGFMGMNIGMTREEVFAVARGNELIAVPKNRDVDFFPIEQRKILTLSIKPEVPFIYLQFFNDTLYAITVLFDEKYVDYFTVSSRLQEKYGKYTSMHPQWRQWQLDGITVKVEKPSVVKYIALGEFLQATAFDKEGHKPADQRKAVLLDGL